MELKFKEYKYLKFKKELKANKLLLVFNRAYTKSGIPQIFEDLNINLFKIANKISRLILINSVYSNYKFLINNVIMMSLISSSYLNLKELIKVSDRIHLLGIKFHKKFYTKRQLQNVITVHFIKNVKFFTKKLNFCVKSFSVKLSK